MYPLFAHRRRPPREARVVVFCVVTLLLALGLVAAKVPPVVVLGLVTWAVLALCINACDVAELAGRLLHVTAQLEDAERSLTALRQERDQLMRALAAARKQLAQAVADAQEPASGRSGIARLLQARMGMSWRRPSRNGHATPSRDAR